MNEAEYFESIDGLWYGYARRWLSPLDWAEVSAWYTAGIPLAAVLAGIQITFQNFRKRFHPDAIRSIAYCAPEVYHAWEECALAQIQASGVKEIDEKVEEGSENKF